MIVKLQEFTIGIKSELVTPASPNFQLSSWPPSREWPVVIDKNGVVVSRWGDPKWNLAPWAGHKLTLNFGDGEARKGRQAEALSSENAHVMRLIATWLIWGRHQGATAVTTISANFNMLRPLVALCNRNGISATRLMRFPKVLEQVPTVIAPSSYASTVSLLQQLYDARDVLGFTIVDPGGLRRIVAAEPHHDHVQTPYIPPRIWLYQITRLRECLIDFLDHQKQIEECFHFCLGIYVKRYGSLEAALVLNKKGNNLT